MPFETAGYLNQNRLSVNIAEASPVQKVYLKRNSASDMVQSLYEVAITEVNDVTALLTYLLI
jgi:hypothetical protein